MAEVGLRGLRKSYGKDEVIHGVDCRIADGEFIVIVGPSGCGKSTLLRAIVGTHLPRQGSILMYDAVDSPQSVVRGPGRDRGVVYQRYSLFPFLTARQNVAIGLLLDQTSIPGRLFGYLAWRKLRRQHLSQAAELLEKVGLLNEGRRREAEWMKGRWWDTLVFGILEKEWRARPHLE